MGYKGNRGESTVLMHLKELLKAFYYIRDEEGRKKCLPTKETMNKHTAINRSTRTPQTAALAWRVGTNVTKVFFARHETTVVVEKAPRPRQC